MQNFKRLERLIKYLEGVSALVIDDPIDLYYLTGLQLSLGRLFVFQDQRPILCVDGRYEETCRQQNLVDVQLWDWKSPLPFQLPDTVGFDALKTTYAQFEQLEKLGASRWVPLQGPVLHQRMIKDADEIEILRQAAVLGAKGYEYVLNFLQEGVSEKEVALELEIFWRRQGAEGLAFPSIIAFGENSSKPHHRASSRLLRHGEPILIDIGVTWQHYHSDMTRVVSWGPMPTQLQHVYQLVKEAADRAYAKCQPGIRIGDVDAAAREWIEEQGYPFIHGLGHGVGLEVHEWPRVRTGALGADALLEPGMVITIEPGIYLPGLGGIRLENTIVITPSGYETLTPSSMDCYDLTCI